MHKESLEVRKKADPEDLYQALLKKILLEAIKEQDSKNPGGAVPDIIVFSVAMANNWDFPVSASGLYGALVELEKDGIIEYDQEEFVVTLVRNIQ